MLGRFLALLIGLVCAAVAFWYALVHTVHSGTLDVPDFVGLDSVQAEQVAHDAGLVLEVVEPGVFSPTAEAGMVAAQEPLPGYHVKTGAVVTVRFSLGSERVPIPRVLGESSQTAQRTLEQLGLDVGASARVFAAGPSDSVVASEPPQDLEVAPGQQVALLVNSTPHHTVWVMPSLLSRPLALVERVCRANGLRLGQVHEVEYPGIPAGVVLRQYPPAGSPVTRSDILTVWVSQ
jgi:beta-lactam-binding protein with PASTA domain